jgi:glycogen operon protein
MMRPRTECPETLGVTVVAGGAEVAVFSADAERIEVCLFDESGAETARVALSERAGDIHHGLVPGMADGQLYGLRAHGPWRPQEGLRFNAAKLLVDPYATCLVRPPGLTSAMASAGAGGFDDLVLDGTDTAPLVPKARARARPSPELSTRHAPAGPRIVYELHVKGFTATHPGIPAEIRGTVAALAHPAAIRHLVDLGVTTVELMPIAAWVDERHLPPLGLSNYWGYNPIAFMAPDPRLAPGGMEEVSATVRALHEAGLEVFLDVVVNHTAESDERGQTFSFRGLDNRSYYRLADNPRFYVNDTGCGHTVALDRAPVVRLVMDTLRHWALEGGFDGFRFDLATVLGRRPQGFDREAPLLAAIDQDPVLRDRVMIAEPWDIGPGGYRLGDFPARWSEWNDRFRDDVRRFWRGDGDIGSLATRLAGSSDIFASRHRLPSASISFVSAHDGFTLADLVSHADKHNEANGEGNRDGHAGEIAWNNGAEGATTDGEVKAARRRDIRALLATLLFSRGTPMIGMGDELGRSQGGNNNAYAQDNVSTWIDWTIVDRDLLAFASSLTALRQAHPVLAADRFLDGRADADGVADVTWLSPQGRVMQGSDWANGSLRTLGMDLAGDGEGAERVIVWTNGAADEIRVVLPEARGSKRWRLASTSDPAGGTAAQDDTHFASFDAVELPGRSVCLFVEEEGGAKLRERGVEPAFVDRIAEMAGIAPEWWEVSGRHTVVSTETKRALLDAMGLPTASTAQARDSLARLQELRRRPDRPAPDATCHVPASLAEGRRRYGVAAQLYTLRRQGDRGVGDFTTLRLLAEASAKEGAVTVAINPVHALFPSSRDRSSPYQPSDRRFLDPAYIDLEAVPDIAPARGAFEPYAAELASIDRERLVDWPAVWRIKRAVLVRCFEVARSRPERMAALDAFRKAGGGALQRFALFQALEERAGRPSADFPRDTPTDPAIEEASAFAVYLQMVADEQLAAAGAGLEIGLYRDLAVGAAPDGAEVWSEPGAFLRGCTVGSPPDPFSAAGQIWNIPPLDPVALTGTDYAHFRNLLRANMRHAGALRIDHAMALRRLFIIPEGATAREGTYLRYPLEGMIRALAEESVAARCLVVGEDLGTVPEGFRERMEAASVLSYRVLFFERDGAVFRAPGSYPVKAVACVATHDLPTLRGWWDGLDLALDRTLGRAVAPTAKSGREADRAALARLVGMEPGPLTPELAAAIHGYLASSPTALVLAQTEDLAGETDPVNVPGTEQEYPNWRRRIDQPTETLFDGPSAKAILQAIRHEGR